jgi:hypothetical protein
MPFIGKGAQTVARNNAFTRTLSGDYIKCAKCGKPVGVKGSTPAIKINKGVYVHSTCR